jgi:methionyl aminopeptidase
MALIKTATEIKKMRAVCKVTALILSRLIANTEVGMTGIQIDAMTRKFFDDAGVEPCFYGLYGFPAVLCVSINKQLIHGIPDGRHFKSGDVIRYDIGARLDGFCSDMARTFVLGSPADERHQKVIDATQRGLDAGIAAVRDGATLVDVAVAIDTVAKVGGYGNVTAFHGHGIGRQVHEDPAVHNSRAYAKPIVLRAGMTLALEPMFTIGSGDVIVDPKNRWDVRAVDGSIGAHIEDTILVTVDGSEILTR